MNSKLIRPWQPLQPWIPIERIESFVQLEPALVILGLALGAWAVYKVFLRSVSEERHRNLSALFANLGMHIVFGTILFTSYWGIRHWVDSTEALDRLSTYLGLITLFSGATVFVKTWRILVFEYLFLGHMRAGVPVLLVNLFTLLLSIFLSGWILSEVFNIRLAPLLATSAVFSLVLGLALQDTLGNLFAGVALQFDKPYEIGDWIEVNHDGQKFIGQVFEISWRATVLISFTEETITLPNRIVGQAEISNYNTKSRPVIRSQSFKIPYGTPFARVKEILLSATENVPLIRKHPSPRVIVVENTESWMTFRLVYFVDDFGAQFIIGDKVLQNAIEALEKNGIQLASSRMLLVKSEAHPHAG